MTGVDAKLKKYWNGLIFKHFLDDYDILMETTSRHSIVVDWDAKPQITKPLRKHASG